MSDKLNILVSLHKGYGLGDAVQVSAILKHLVKHRPNWSIDYQAESGRYCVGRNIADRCFEYGKNPNPDKRYDAEAQILLFDTQSNWHDRPNTRVSYCLHSQFGIGWDRDCGRYRVDVRPEVTAEVRRRWSSFLPQLNRCNRRVVALHYRGDSSPGHKDLSEAQAFVLCDYILEIGCIPLMIDWRGTWLLSTRADCGRTGRMSNSSEWGRDAEYNCAVIRQCAAFIGIDSGPSKCAASTDVPSLVIWTGHNPCHFFDPAPNVTHLIPRGYAGLEPECNDRGALAWFEANNNILQYNRDPVSEVKRWLESTLL